ncbi:MAG: T9SS type A sorting domain-containing protein [Candidatus Cloacimonetes bacterium]|nr:T9SS type A sorting domain-containing protein [Candidatus Cloacimonadota bacterium]
MRRLALILTLLGLIAVSYAALVWPDAVPIRQGVNIEWFRTGIETHDGGAIYVWSDTKLGERDLWAQKVDAQGNMVWGEPLLVDGKPDRQEDPVVTRTSDNYYVIAWIDFSDDLDGSVYAQKVNADGQLMWQTGGVPVCVVPGVQLSLNMEPDNAGGVYIVWMDSRNPSKDLFGQRLSATGAPVWSVNGIPIADGIGDEIQNTMLPDGQGGMMIGYTHTYSSNEDIYVKRFLPNGTMAWTQPLALATGTGNQGKVRMASIGNSEFIYTWQDQTNDDPDILAQKVNINGQMVWGQHAVVYGDSGTPNFTPQLNPRIVATSDNGAIIIWEDHRLDNQDPDLFAQKISSAGNVLWGAAGIQLCVAEFAQIGPRMSSDGAGGCYVVWDDLRNGNTPNDDIYAQHLNASGTALWEVNGRAVCTAGNTQNGSLVKFSGNHVYVNWMDIRNGSVGIYYQVLDSSGTPLLEQNGREVFWGLSGDTPLENYLILPRADDTAIIWQDTRFANLGYQIFFQYLNPDGSVDLETNGRPVTASTGEHQVTPAAAVTPDGHIAVAWEDKRHDNPKIYLQLLSPTGEKLWGDTGMELTQNSPLRQKDPFISYDQATNSFYVGWSNYDQVGTGFYYHVYGQRIQNGQKMWGPNGKIISDLATAELNNECVIFDMRDSYYVWQRYNPMDGTQSIYVKLVDANGDPLPGWPAEGLRASTHNSFDTVQMVPTSARTDQGLFVMWRDQREDWVSNYYGQHISATAQRLWDPLGVNLADYGREQEKPVILTDGRTDLITFAWCENINGMHDIIAHRYSLDGNPLWGNLGYYVVQKDSSQTNPTFASFDNNGIAVAWTEYLALESDIYYKYINGDGTFAGSPGGDIVCAAGKAQYEPKLTSMNNHAYAIWADGRSSGKTEILGLYAQKISNDTVANDDPTAPPPAGFRLGQNHPNPFNPSTAIQFSTADPDRHYSLEIYNLKGQRIKTLHEGKLPAGNHSLIWNGKDANGQDVASGVYLYRLSDGSHFQSRKMLMMK